MLIIRKIRVLLTILVFSSPMIVNASLISYQGYSYNPETETIIGGDKEWIRWDQTLGLSFNDAKSEIPTGIINDVYYGEGWRIATNTDVSGLLTDFFPELTWDVDKTTSQSLEVNYIEGDDVLTSVPFQFFQLFGHGRFSPSADPEVDDPRYGNVMIFGDDNGPVVNGFNIIDDYRSIRAFDIDGNPIYQNNNARIVLRDLVWDVVEFSSSVGVVIVRDVSEVNSPSVVLLVLVFITLLLGTRETTINTISEVQTT